MKRTLYFKFIAAYLVFGFLSFITITTFTSDITMKYLTEQKAEDLYKEATLVSKQYASSFYSNAMTPETLRSHLIVLDTYLSAQIWVIDTKGQLILSSRETIDPKKPVKIQDFDPTSTGGKYYLTGNFFDMFHEEMLSVFYPITSHFTVKGYVVIHASISQIKASSDRLLNISYLSLGIIFVLSLIILAAFSFVVYIPLKKITTAAHEYALGNLSHELSIEKDDEIGYLASSLNFMSSEVQKATEYQKKFIANVSHDFRSPLTSIKGYIEAMLDGTIPPEMQERYLNIVLSEAERLNKLTQSMLDLNNFDKNGILLNKTDFDINKVIKNIAISFEGTCTPKKISIELILTGKTLFVHADLGKIQQVLYNLIDNAIKFSREDSSIFVETTEKNDKIFVSVKDSGIGIPKDSIKKIWDRFYKTDLSRGKDKKGTGLGLSIVKEIITSHNETIDVVSTEGVGTEFIFTLSRSKVEE